MNKKQKAGMAGRGEGAFIPRKSKKDRTLQLRIERVVVKAKGRETISGVDVMRVNPSAWSLKGTRLG